MIARRAVSAADPLGHGTPELFERYVLGVLLAGEQRALEDHVSECLPCGRLLAAEARREMALGAAMANLARVERQDAQLSAGAGGSAATVPRRAATPLLLAVAAALALVAGLGRQDRGGAFTDGGPSVPVQLAGRAAGEETLLACLQLGDDAALCPAPAGRSTERASRSRESHHVSHVGRGALCRVSDGTCTLMTRAF